MKNPICPECKKGSLIEKTGDYQTTYLDREGKTHQLIVPNLTWKQCDDCGDVVLDSNAMQTIEAARRKALGLLMPDEIRSLRSRLRKTQKAMSQLLGIGEKTYCRWESGSYIQSEASDRYLRLLILNRSNVEVLEQLAGRKTAVDASEELEKLRHTFRSVKNIELATEKSRPFVRILDEGSLLHAA